MSCNPVRRLQLASVLQERRYSCGSEAVTAEEEGRPAFLSRLFSICRASSLVITNPTLAGAYKSIVGKLKGDTKSGS